MSAENLNQIIADKTKCLGLIDSAMYLISPKSCAIPSPITKIFLCCY